MAFRIQEIADQNFQRALSYLADTSFSPKARKEIHNKLDDICVEFGPVVDTYPSWHPLVRLNNTNTPASIPSTASGYQGLDHTVHFANAFISCPYGDGSRIIDSVESLPQQQEASIRATALDLKMYNEGTTAVLVSCHWNRALEPTKTIPKSLAVPLMIEKEMEHWREAQLAEKWETMRPYILGQPAGSRASLFVSKETGMYLQKAYKMLIESGMFGPLRMDF